MRTATIVRITAATLLVSGLWAGAARADDQIKAGKWEFTILMPEVQGTVNLPPKELAPGVQMGPGGRMSFTRCITSDDPFPPWGRSHDANLSCEIDKTDATGGTVSWSTTCTTPKATVLVESITHYHGETADGEYTTRVAFTGHEQIEKSQAVTGRYLGPCDAK